MLEVGLWSLALVLGSKFLVLGSLLRQVHLRVPVQGAPRKPSTKNKAQSTKT
jgi:hypothetical protein